MGKQPELKKCPHLYYRLALAACKIGHWCDHSGYFSTCPKFNQVPIQPYMKDCSTCIYTLNPKPCPPCDVNFSGWKYIGDLNNPFRND